MTYAVLVALAVAYGFGVRRARSWSRARTLSWLLGLTGLGIALGPALDAGADERLVLHMVQHQLIGLVAAPALVAGAPLRLLLSAADRDTRRAVGRALSGRLARTLGRPVVGFVAFVAVLAVVHVPGVYDAALREPALHALEHGALFWSAVLLWTPLIAAGPGRRRVHAVGTVGVLAGAMAAMGVLGAVLAGSSHVIYDFYARSHFDALADQHLAGGIMSVGGMVAVLPALLWLAWRALAEEERRQCVREARA